MSKQTALDMPPREVCLNPKERCAKEYHMGDIHQLLTEPNVMPSIESMVNTGIVGAGSSHLYDYPEQFEDDDEMHEQLDMPHTMRQDRVIINDLIGDLETPEERKEEPKEEPKPDDNGQTT